MTERQKKILEIVVKEYVQSAEPVSSGRICSLYSMDCSSATIRNDLNQLTKEGYLEQLHTSGGRIPSDKAYRFIVDQIMGDKILTLEEQKKIQREYIKLKAEYKRLAKLTSRLLGRFADGIALGGDLSELDVCETGISRLLKEPEYSKTSNITEAIDLIEFIDDHLNEVYTGLEDDKHRVFIGHENIFSKACDHSVILSGYRLKTGEKGILALIGPKRMDYQKNLAAVRGIIESITKNVLPIYIISAAYLLIISN